MDWLRWILLAVGAVLIGAIYVAGRRSDRARQSPADTEPGASGPLWSDPGDMSTGPATEVTDWLPTDLDPPAPSAPADDAAAEPEPTAGDTVAAAASSPRAETPPQPKNEAAPGAEPESERILLLYLLAPEGERLVGTRLADAFARHGLEHGELGAFHARSREAREATDFSVANVVEPGTFDPATMGTLSTPGLVLFLRLPGPPSPGPAFERMLATARALTEELGGRLLDERRAPLTAQTEQHLRDQLRATQARPSPAERRP